MDLELINNEAAKQYEFHIDGFVAKIEYKKSGDKIYLIHTEIPKEFPWPHAAHRPLLRLGYYRDTGR